MARKHNSFITGTSFGASCQFHSICCLRPTFSMQFHDTMIMLNELCVCVCVHVWFVKEHCQRSLVFGVLGIFLVMKQIRPFRLFRLYWQMCVINISGQTGSYIWMSICIRVTRCRCKKRQSLKRETKVINY